MVSCTVLGVTISLYVKVKQFINPFNCNQVTKGTSYEPKLPTSMEAYVGIILQPLWYQCKVMLVKVHVIVLIQWCTFADSYLTVVSINFSGDYTFYRESRHEYTIYLSGIQYTLLVHTMHSIVKEWGNICNIELCVENAISVTIVLLSFIYTSKICFSWTCALPQCFINEKMYPYK